mgnify:CR=1 FL=1
MDINKWSTVQCASTIQFMVHGALIDTTSSCIIVHHGIRRQGYHGLSMRFKSTYKITLKFEKKILFILLIGSFYGRLQLNQTRELWYWNLCYRNDISKLAWMREYVLSEFWFENGIALPFVIFACMWTLIDQGSHGLEPWWWRST